MVCLFLNKTQVLAKGCSEFEKIKSGDYKKGVMLRLSKHVGKGLTARPSRASG
jgi:hypothetical protein